jgi:hypothetical protein
MTATPASAWTAKAARKIAAAAEGEADRDEPRGVEAPPARQRSEPRSRLLPNKRRVARALTRRPRRSIATARLAGGIIAALFSLAKAIANSTPRQRTAITDIRATSASKRGTWRGSAKQRKARRPRWQARSLVNMTGEQRLDYLAACDGKITWAWYHAKWRPTL